MTVEREGDYHPDNKNDNLSAPPNEKLETSSTDTEYRNEKEAVPEYTEKGAVAEFVEVWQFSWRSSIVGSLLGCVIAASNMYMGLKTGWLMSSSLFGAILSFAILKPLSRVLPYYLGGGPFGAKENCSAQTAASASGGLAAGFVAAIPAMYQLGLLDANNIGKDMAKMALWTIAAAFYGLFFAIPLRKHFVVNHDYVFPTPRAAAITIQSLHDSVTGEKEGIRAAIHLGVWFLISLFITLMGVWIPGIFNNPHILYWIGHAAGNQQMMESDALWHWSFVWDFAFFGAGLMTPGATVWSFFIGNVLAFGITGPLMWRDGSIGQPYGFKEFVTAQSFWLWPGISLMVFSSFAELFVHYDVLWQGVKIGCINTWNGIRRLVNRGGNFQIEQDPNDPLLEHEQVPALWWMGGLLASIIFTCVILGVFFGIQVYLSLLAILLAFILSFIGLQASAQTDINPLGSIGKVTQLIFASIPHPSVQAAQMVSLTTGNIASSAASQSVAMVSDLKTGHLLGASPRSQFYAQLVGSIFAIGMALALWYVYASAYPCIVKPMDKCEFDLVAVKIWVNVTKLLTEGKVDIPRASIITTIVFAVFSVVYTVVREKWIPEKYHPYMLNLNALGIGMTQSHGEVALAFVIGWATTTVWRRLSPESHSKLMYSVAAGSLAGMGIGSVIQALLRFGDIPSVSSMVTAGCMLNSEGVPEC
ncbi:uncharacterized protein VTP21DRAFT_3892 [Calcarisporiella thermophila]|uniref:uncharacterized protein n=1 Tax=Calcarisporiella thermophila TaxID=911321 RepID=UPI003743FDF7